MPKRQLAGHGTQPSVLQLVVKYFENKEDDGILSEIVNIRKNCPGTYHFIKRVFNDSRDIHLIEADGKCVGCYGHAHMSHDYVIYTFYYSFQNFHKPSRLLVDSFIKEETIRVRKWDCFQCRMIMWECKQNRMKNPVVFPCQQQNMKLRPEFVGGYHDLFANLEIDIEECGSNDNLWTEIDKLEDKINIIRDTACQKAATAIVNSLKTGKKYVEIHGACGLGKTSRIPLKVSNMIKDTLIIVCEPRRGICVAEYKWLKHHYAEYDINLCVGTDDINVVIANNMTTESFVQKMMTNADAAKPSIIYTTSGKVEHACAAVICKSAFTHQNLRPIVAIFSDWEERHDHYGYAIHRLNLMVSSCNCKCVICFASNAELSGEWKKIFMTDGNEEGITRLHLPDEADLHKCGLKGKRATPDMNTLNFSSFTYKLHTPKLDNIYYLSMWENYIFNLVANLSPSLLSVNGTVLVKALSIESVLRLTKRLQEWQDSHGFQPLDKIKV